MSLIARLEEIVGHPDSTARLNEILENLELYIEAHFEYEESIMRRVGFPCVDEHSKQHQDMRQHLRSLSALAGGGFAVPPEHAIQLVEGWLNWHLDGADRRLSDFLKERRIDLSKFV